MEWKKIEKREILIWIGSGPSWKVAETNKMVCLGLMFFMITFNRYYQYWQKPYFKKCILLPISLEDLNVPSLNTEEIQNISNIFI